jgi:hypothetical protein
MSTIQQRCPSCHQMLELPAGSSGRQASCPACQTQFVIAGAGAMPQSPTPPSPAQQTFPASTAANPYSIPLGGDRVDEPLPPLRGTNPYQPSAAAPAPMAKVGDIRIGQRSVEEIFGATWAIFKARWGSLVGALIIVIAASLGLVLVTSLVGMVTKEAMDPIAGMVLNVVVNVVSSLVSAWLYLGLTRSRVAAIGWPTFQPGAKPQDPRLQMNPTNPQPRSGDGKAVSVAATRLVGGRKTPAWGFAPGYHPSPLRGWMARPSVAATRLDLTLAIERQNAFGFRGDDGDLFFVGDDSDRADQRVALLKDLGFAVRRYLMDRVRVPVGHERHAGGPVHAVDVLERTPGDDRFHVARFHVDRHDGGVVGRGRPQRLLVVKGQPPRVDSGDAFTWTAST